jgi:hypothetical protein
MEEPEAGFCLATNCVREDRLLRAQPLGVANL